MNKKKIEAEIIADSLSPQGNRITTFLLTYPRFIHSELLTHRIFSRNSASSRAIPFQKMVKMVEEDPFIPIAWQKSHVGMQGTEYLEEKEAKIVTRNWLSAKNEAIAKAKELNQENVTKQLCNRLLEPFMWHTTLVTFTESSNFFSLRLPEYYLENVPTVNEDLSLNSKTLTLVGKSKKELLKQINEIDNDSYTGFKTIINNYSDLDWLHINKSQAEIHIQALAEAMWDAMNESTPKKLKSGDWHIPFGDKLDTKKLAEAIGFKTSDYDWYNKELWSKIKIATARCARLSYMTFDGEIDYEKDIKLHDQLLASEHMSPFEHCARAMSNEEYYTFIKGKSNANWDTDLVTDNTYEISAQFDHNVLGWCNNFKGFIPYRYLIENREEI